MQNITLQQVGKAVGLCTSQVCQHFTGSRTIGKKTAQKYADFLNKTPGQIIDMDPSELETLVKAKVSATVPKESPKQPRNGSNRS